MSVVAIDTAARLAAWVLRTDAAGGILEEREIPGGQLDARLAEAIAELLDDDTEAIVAVADAGRGGVYLARFVGRGGHAEEVSEVERHDATTVQSVQHLVATTAIADLDVRRVDPRHALAAAVPWALARPQLVAAGLAATHAQPLRDGDRADTLS